MTEIVSSSHLKFHLDPALDAFRFEIVGHEVLDTSPTTAVRNFCLVLMGILGLLWVMYEKLPKDDPRVEKFYTTIVCMSMACTSISMILLNKVLIHALDAPCLVSCAQMLMATIAMGGPMLFNPPEMKDLKQIKYWCFVPILFALILVSANYTYGLISLSVMTCVRNLSPMVALPFEYASAASPETRPTFSKLSVGSMVLMLVGAIMYAGGLTDLSMIGVVLCIGNMIVAITDRLVQRRLLSTECKDLPLQVCAVMNNGFAMIPSIGVSLLTGEMARVTAPANLARWTDPSVLFLLVLSGAVGMGICYFGLMAQRAISATSFMVLQNFSKIGVITVGVIFFQDPIKSPAMALGLALSVAGSLGYGKSVQEANAAKLEQGKAAVEKTPLIKERV